MAVFIMVFSYSVAYPGSWSYLEHRYESKPGDVLKADRFVQKDRYLEGFLSGKLVGYVINSKDWASNHVGYSGKHIETLVGMDTAGNLTGVKVLYHSEPIVLIGLKEDNLNNFIAQYAGKSVIKGLSLGNDIKMDALTGATVTAEVENAIILESAKKVAAAAGLIKYSDKKGKKISQKFEAMGFSELVASGGVKNLIITSKDMGIESKEAYLDLYFGVVSAPTIGKNILGEKTFNEVMSTLKEGETPIFIVSRGQGSFKGSGFVRGGVFERFSIEQGSRTYVFTDKDYSILTELSAKGAPAIKEGGVFIIRAKDFDPTVPFKLKLMVSLREGATKKFHATAADYALADRFTE